MYASGLHVWKGNGIINEGYTYIALVLEYLNNKTWIVNLVLASRRKSRCY